MSLVTLECVGGPMDGETCSERFPAASFFEFERTSVDANMFASPSPFVPLTTKPDHIVTGRYVRAWIPKSNTDVWLWDGYR